MIFAGLYLCSIYTNICYIDTNKHYQTQKENAMEQKKEERQRPKHEHIEYEELRRLICRDVYKATDPELLMVIHELLQ